MEILQFELLKQFPELTHGISTAEIGNLSYKWGENKNQVKANRESFFKLLNIGPETVVASQLEHGIGIHTLTTSDCGKGVGKPEEGLIGDGFFTKESGVFPFIIVGDCIALFFYDPVVKACGVVHAGWRGVDAYLPKKAIEYMTANFGSNPANILVCASPSLQAKSAKFKELEQSKLERWQKYVYSEGEFNHADVSSFARDQILGSGVLKENIEWSNIDTYEDKNFYSHRRSVEQKEPEARFGCIIGLK